MRLIDADKLVDMLYDNEFASLCPLDEVSGVIDACPTVDAEVVVRCRDCAKYHAEIAWCDEWSCFEKDGEPCDPADSMQWRELEPDEYCGRFQANVLDGIEKADSREEETRR